jgi:hypothetical protein
VLLTEILPFACTSLQLAVGGNCLSGQVQTYFFAYREMEGRRHKDNRNVLAEIQTKRPIEYLMVLGFTV